MTAIIVVWALMRCKKKKKIDCQLEEKALSCMLCHSVEVMVCSPLFLTVNLGLFSSFQLSYCAVTPDKAVYRRCEINFLFKIFLFRLIFSNILKTNLHWTSVAVTSSALNQCRCLWTSKSGHGLKSLSDSTIAHWLKGKGSWVVEATS